MAKKNNVPQAVVDVLKAAGVDPRESVWDCHGTWVVLHKALEIVAVKTGIRFDPPKFVENDAEKKIAVVCVTGELGDRIEWSIGEAAPYNNKNSYPYAMAEKRAKDRVILKLVGLHGYVYSEEEADDFKASAQNRQPPPEEEKPQEQPKDEAAAAKKWTGQEIADFGRKTAAEVKECKDLDQLAELQERVTPYIKALQDRNQEKVSAAANKILGFFSARFQELSND